MAEDDDRLQVVPVVQLYQWNVLKSVFWVKRRLRLLDFTILSQFIPTLLFRKQTQRPSTPRDQRKRDLAGTKAGLFGGYYSSVDLTAVDNDSCKTGSVGRNLKHRKGISGPKNLENPFLSSEDSHPTAVAAQALWETYSANPSSSTAPASSVKQTPSQPPNTSESSAHPEKSRSTSFSHKCNEKLKKITERLVNSKIATEIMRQREMDLSQQRDEGIDDLDREESVALLKRNRGKYTGRETMGWR
ncbi:hypothetical protein BZA77DRAFT_368655 [Pyronema omphalodes]|nr:hypothetical protein BZA77DRAFT_368655 [Pyronema omphalodes]